MISCVIHSCVLTLDTIFAPACAIASFPPVDSRCQCVFTSVFTGPASFSTSPACAASPQSTSRLPPSPAIATTLFPAPVISVILSVSFVALGASAARAARDNERAAAPPAKALRKPRREGSIAFTLYRRDPGQRGCGRGLVG